jgi:hypothetical protein
MPRPDRRPLPAHKSANLNDRLNAAAAAKRAAIERFRAIPGRDDPSVLERQAAQKAISDARDARIAERKTVREAEAARLAAAEAAKIAEREARELVERKEAAEAAARTKTLEAERKAARDARYASRKGRR